MERALPTTGQRAEELKRQLALEREERPFLIHRDDAGTQHLTVLEPGRQLRIGRSESADLRLAFDEEVSRLHAEVSCAAGEWLLIDDGLSSNGSFVNGSRVTGRRRLRDGDVVRFGRTVVVFRDPSEPAGGAETVSSRDLPAPRDLTAMQRQVLAVLCGPVGRGSVAEPATNQAIAAELNLSLGSVKAHLRELYRKFGVADLPATRKRIRLAELALISGAVSPYDS